MHQLACPMWMQIASRIATESCYTNGFRVSSTPCDQAHLSHKSLSQTWNGRSGIPSSFSSNIPYPDIFQEWTNWLSFPMVFRYGFPMVFQLRDLPRFSVPPKKKRLMHRNCESIEPASATQIDDGPDHRTWVWTEDKVPKNKWVLKIENLKFPIYMYKYIYVCMYR